MKTSGLAVDGAFAARFGERSPTLPAVDYTSDMLQRTTEPPAWPDRLDYLVVERIARDMRNQYVASLLGRAKRALGARFAQGARSSIGHAR
jgi:hypothetical protein